VEEEKLLQEMSEAKTPLNIVAENLNKSQNSVRIKLKRLGQRVVVQQNCTTTTTSAEKLPSKEDALCDLNDALNQSRNNGVSEYGYYLVHFVLSGHVKAFFEELLL
jgi:hypothetical protein